MVVNVYDRNDVCRMQDWHSNNLSSFSRIPWRAKSERNNSVGNKVKMCRNQKMEGFTDGSSGNFAHSE